MEDLLIDTLSELGFPVMLQGSLAENQKYPDHFFTFWNYSSNGNSFYDNNETSIVYEYSVNFYSIDPEKVYTELRKAKKILKEKGFTVTGDGYSLVSDEPTHDGRGINVKYLQ